MYTVWGRQIVLEVRLCWSKIHENRLFDLLEIKETLLMDGQGATRKEKKRNEA